MARPAKPGDQPCPGPAFLMALPKQAGPGSPHRGCPWKPWFWSLERGGFWFWVPGN